MVPREKKLEPGLSIPSGSEEIAQNCHSESGTSVLALGEGFGFLFNMKSPWREIVSAV